MLIKTDINMFILNIENFFRDFRGSRYLHLNKVYFFVGHPVGLSGFSSQSGGEVA